MQGKTENLNVPAGVVDVILDTDTYNEIDDQFALAYMLLSPERIRPVGICAAPFLNAKSQSPADGMEKRPGDYEGAGADGQRGRKGYGIPWLRAVSAG